jgi:hypothetical protein
VAADYTGAGAQIAFAMREEWRVREREKEPPPIYHAALLQPTTYAPLLLVVVRLFVLTRVRRTNSLRRRRFASEATREMNLHRKRRQQRETGDFAAEEINC